MDVKVIVSNLTKNDELAIKHYNKTQGGDFIYFVEQILSFHLSQEFLVNANVKAEIITTHKNLKVIEILKSIIKNYSVYHEEGETYRDYTICNFCDKMQNAFNEEHEKDCLVLKAKQLLKELEK